MKHKMSKLESLRKLKSKRLQYCNTATLSMEWSRRTVKSLIELSRNVILSSA